jgi:hypothetical protein
MLAQTKRARLQTEIHRGANAPAWSAINAARAVSYQRSAISQRMAPKIQVGFRVFGLTADG